jgi:hypothetical protein
MTGNSPKPGETRNPQVLAVELALDWLDQSSGQQRIPMAIRHLLEATRVAFERGEAAPEKDSLTLSELWRLHRGSDAGPATPLRASEVSRWWTSRENHLAQLLADRGSDWTPRLVVHPGGGRHHATRFSIAIEPVEAACDNPLEPTEVAAVDTNGADEAVPSQTIVYRVDPAKPALWLRLLVGHRPFPIDSWRGYVLLGSAVVNFVLIGFMALVSYLDWSRPRPVSTANLASLALFGLIAAGLWVQTRPIRQLPTRRVTIAGAGYLAMSELYGQLRAMHDADRKAGGRVFSVVRHWAICPICSAEIDLAEGGASFPERLVGRCHDAPAEHVFSFDPERLVGHPLRAV